eukprot:g132.t1
MNVAAEAAFASAENRLLIQVVGHEMAQGKRRVLYVIKVTLGLFTITIKRRCRDFHRLHDALRLRYPQEELPTLPPKTFKRSFEKAYIEQKSLALGAYLTRLQENAIFLHSAELQSFLGDSSLLFLLTVPKDPADVDEDVNAAAPCSPPAAEIVEALEEEECDEKGENESGAFVQARDLAHHPAHALMPDLDVLGLATVAAETAAAALARADADWSPAKQFAAAEASIASLKARCRLMSQMLQQVNSEAEDMREELAKYHRVEDWGIRLHAEEDEDAQEGGSRCGASCEEVAGTADARKDKVAETWTGSATATAAAEPAADRGKENEPINANCDAATATDAGTEQQQQKTLIAKLREELSSERAARHRQRLRVEGLLSQANKRTEELFVALEEERQLRVQANEALTGLRAQCARLRSHKKILCNELRKRGKLPDQEEQTEQASASNKEQREQKANPISETSGKIELLPASFTPPAPPPTPTPQSRNSVKLEDADSQPVRAASARRLDRWSQRPMFPAAHSAIDLRFE